MNLHENAETLVRQWPFWRGPREIEMDATNGLDHLSPFFDLMRLGINCDQPTEWPVEINTVRINF
jgi:hypothetical protein